MELKLNEHHLSSSLLSNQLVTHIELDIKKNGLRYRIQYSDQDCDISSRCLRVSIKKHWIYRKFNEMHYERSKIMNSIKLNVYQQCIPGLVALGGISSVSYYSNEWRCPFIDQRVWSTQYIYHTEYRTSPTVYHIYSVYTIPDGWYGESRCLEFVCLLQEQNYWERSGSIIIIFCNHLNTCGLS